MLGGRIMDGVEVEDLERAGYRITAVSGGGQRFEKEPCSAADPTPPGC